MTNGKCAYCTKKAVLMRSYFTPVCEEHAEFPRKVLRVAVKKQLCSIFELGIMEDKDERY